MGDSVNIRRRMAGALAIAPASPLGARQAHLARHGRFEVNGGVGQLAAGTSNMNHGTFGPSSDPHGTPNFHAVGLNTSGVRGVFVRKGPGPTPGVTDTLALEWAPAPVQKAQRHSVQRLDVPSGASSFRTMSFPVDGGGLSAETPSIPTSMAQGPQQALASDAAWATNALIRFDTARALARRP